MGSYEDAAEHVLEQAGFDCWDVPSPFEVAERLWGLGSVVYVQGMRALGELHQLGDGAFQARLRRSLEPRRAAFTLAHELGHWADLTRGLGVDGEELERACDYIAGAIMMPRRPYLEALAEFGDDWEELSVLFDVSETAAALRAAELTGESLAVVAGVVRARGDLQWHTEQDLRRYAKQETPGIARARLRDDPRRTVLRLA